MTDIEKVNDLITSNGYESAEDAADFIDYNTIGSLCNAGEYGPIIMYPLT